MQPNSCLSQNEKQAADPTRLTNVYACALLDGRSTRVGETMQGKFIRTIELRRKRRDFVTLGDGTRSCIEESS